MPQASVILTLFVFIIGLWTTLQMKSKDSQTEKLSNDNQLPWNIAINKYFAINLKYITFMTSQ